MIISVVVIIVCLLIGGVLGYSNISVQDVDRGYTCNSTVSNVKRSELLKLDSSFKPKINYMNKGQKYSMKISRYMSMYLTEKRRIKYIHYIIKRQR